MFKTITLLLLLSLSSTVIASSDIQTIDIQACITELEYQYTTDSKLDSGMTLSEYKELEKECVIEILGSN